MSALKGDRKAVGAAAPADRVGAQPRDTYRLGPGPTEADAVHARPRQLLNHCLIAFAGDNGRHVSGASDVPCWHRGGGPGDWRRTMSQAGYTAALRLKERG